MSNKRIIFRVTRKYMQLNRRRTAITFAGILFMVILMTCVFVGRDTAIDYLERVAELDKGSWHVIAYGLDAGQQAALRQSDEVESVGFSRHVGYADLAQSANPLRPFLEIKAYTPEVFGLLNITVLEGRLPENENEIVISAAAAEDGSPVAVGDTIRSELFGLTITGIDPTISGTVFPFEGIEVHYGETLAVPAGFPYYDDNTSFRMDKAPTGESFAYTVVGIIRSPYFEKANAAGYTALTCMDGGTAGGGTVNAVIRLDLDRVDSAGAFAARLQASAGSELEIDMNEFLLAFSAKGSDSGIRMLSVAIEVFFVVLVIGASLILIYNVFNMSYGERTKYLGMLSSVGATRRQKRWSIYCEVLTLLVPALPLGILLGLGIILGGMASLKPHIDKLLSTFELGIKTAVPIKLSCSAGDVVIVAVMSLVTVMLSALIPAVRVGRIGPVESIRGSAVGSSKRFRMKRGLLARGRAEMLLAVCGTTRCRYLTRGIVRSIAVFGTLVVVTLFGARAVIAVTAQKADPGDVTLMTEGYNYFLTGSGEEGALFEAAAGLIAGHPAVSDVKTMDEIFMVATIDGGILSDAYIETLRELMDWYGLSEEYQRSSLANTLEWGEMINLLVLDDEDYRAVGKKCGADLSASGSGQPAVMLFDHLEMDTDSYGFEGIQVDYRYFEVNDVYNVQPGDTVTLSLMGPFDELPALDLTFEGFADDHALEGLYSLRGRTFYGIVDRSAADAIAALYADAGADRSPIDRVLLFALDETTDEGQALLRELSDICGENENVIYLGKTELLSGMDSLKQAAAAIIRILAYCFAALVSVICLLNLYNTIRGRAAERGRETAVLRSMGMTDRQLTRMHSLENVLLLARGYAAAAVVSTALILLLRAVIDRRFGHISLPAPWLAAVLTAAFIGAASAVMTRLCTRPAGRESIADRLRSETV